MEFSKEAGRIALFRHGESVAYVTFPLSEPGVAEIDHTFVSDQLRGQGVAAKLMQAAADEIRAAGWKARPTCSYAAAWFDRHPEYADILARD